MTSYLYHPWLHHVVTLLHICAGLFWLGWIVFIFFLLIPVVREQVPEAVDRIMPALKRRVRRFVFWMILLIAGTGVYNMHYRGLLDPDVLLGSAYGHRFLIKLGAALLLFGIYFAAPYLLGGEPGDEGDDKDCGHAGDGPDVTGLVLHAIAMVSGLVAALIGISLGG